MTATEIGFTAVLPSRTSKKRATEVLARFDLTYDLARCCSSPAASGRDHTLDGDLFCWYE